MSVLSRWISISEFEKPYIHFESSLDDEQVVAGYVPVKSTLDVLSFLTDATATHASQGRAVICHGSYGSGKSRLCSVLARLFRDGFESPSLQPVWDKLAARGEATRLSSLRNTMNPGGGTWRPWLVVSVYGAGIGESISNCLINALFKAIKKAGLDQSILGDTIHRAAARRLSEMLENGASYVPASGSAYSSAEQLKRALEEDSADDALDSFRDFYRSTTYGTEFDEWVRSSGSISLEAHDVFPTVAQRIQSYGFEGIVVIWDEFGFFIEEMLRGSEQGSRSLGREAMSLQNFIERACGSSQLGRKVLLLGFTHVGLTEYGSRQGLGQADQDRLSTVADRFRNPSIAIQLSVSEAEGYHLLAGLIHRTEEGTGIFANPIPRLQNLATRMTSHTLWQHFGSALSCYNEIVAPCYPLHPATSSALMLLSDQVSQRARTTFYYLQNRDNGGLASQLERRNTPNAQDIGSNELLRVYDIFEFFRAAIREKSEQLYAQYEQAVARFPNASDFEVKILQTTLILSVIATPAMAPTTDFLSLCMCDVAENDVAARALHESLKRLNDSCSLWKNEATDVWGFIGTQGPATGLENELEEEKALVPKQGAAQLLRASMSLQREVVDLIGDFDLDPATSGIVRRIGINLLPLDDGALEDVLAKHPVNSAKDSCTHPWRSARVYLLATDSESELDRWRHAITQVNTPNYYFVLPSSSLGIDRELVRDLIAAKELLKKTAAGTHKHEVLEARLTRLRTDLSQQFGKLFGNNGIGSGATVIVRGGTTDVTLPITSWNELLPAIAEDLEDNFKSQITVRCGAFNEWRTGQSFSPIEKIVKRILRFDEAPEWRAPFLNFGINSQEAAIVDGVLVENRLLNEDPLTGLWSLEAIDADTRIESLLEVQRFFQKGNSGDKEIGKLFQRLINPPFGIPNGIIPLLIALVARSEGSRLVFYSGSQGHRVTESQLPKAIAEMAKQPSHFRARYNKLSSRQRIVFCAVGVEMGVKFPEKVQRGEQLFEQAEAVRAVLRDWIAPLPEIAIQSKSLSDSQRHLSRLLRQQVPPQLSLLADSLIEFFSQDVDSLTELNKADATTTSFEAMSKYWGSYRLAIERYIDGVRAPIQKIVRELATNRDADDGYPASNITHAVQQAGSMFGDESIFNRTLDSLVSEGTPSSSIDEVIAIINSKRPEHLTEEDYGKAASFLEITADIQKNEESRKQRQQFELVQPNGKRMRVARVEKAQASQWLQNSIHHLIQAFSLTNEEAAALVFDCICRVLDPSISTAEATVNQPQVPCQGGDLMPLEPGDGSTA